MTVCRFLLFFVRGGKGGGYPLLVDPIEQERKPSDVWILGAPDPVLTLLLILSQCTSTLGPTTTDY